MIVSLFRRKNAKSNAIIVDKIYEAIIQAARTPELYANMGVPDAPLGRFESLSAHMIVFLHRTRDKGGALEELAQDVLDEFFKDVDHSIRELGIGDAGVPKRMKKLGKMFYGRMGPYWEGLDTGETEAFAAALQRNIRPDDPDGLDGHAVANHLIGFKTIMASIDEATLMAGDMSALKGSAFGRPAGD